MPEPGSLDQFAETFKSFMEGSPQPSTKEEASPPPEERAEPAPSEPQQDATAEQPEEESAEGGIETFDELAENLGVSREDLEGLKVGLKVNGQLVETKLADAFAKFQIDAAAEDRLKDAKAQEAEVKSKRAELEKGYTERAQQLDTLIGLARQTLSGNVEQQLKEIASLRTEDPQEYYVKRAQIEDQYRDLQRLESEYQRVVGEHVAKARDELRKTLPEYVPEWRDSSTRDKELRLMDDYLLSQGFSSEQLAQVLDPKAIAIVRKAMLFDAGTKVARKAQEKKSSKIKLASTSAPERRPSAVQTKKVQSLKEDLKKSGSTRAFAELYKATRFR